MLLGKFYKSRSRIASKFFSLFKEYKTPILYTSGAYIKAIAQLIVGFVIAKFITPDDLGLWNTISLCLTYSVFLQAGVINGLNLELPAALGRGEVKEAYQMAGTAFTVVICISFLVLTLGLGTFAFFDFDNEKIRYGLLAISFLIALTYYQTYLNSTFRSNNSFLKLSFVQIIEAGVNLVTLILVISFLYYGLIIKAVLAVFISVTILHFNRPIKAKLLWDPEKLLQLLKVGFPIFGLVYLDTISSTIDKVWLIKYSSLKDVGLYSFAFYALNLFSLFSTSVATYVYPRMTYNYGKNNDKSILRGYVKRITLILLVVQAPAVIVGYFSVPTLITIFFPKYIESIFPMQILLIAGLFKGCVVGVNVLWSIKAWRHMVTYQVLYTLMLIGFSFLGVKVADAKTVGVAFGVLAANIINLVSGLYLSYSATKSKIN